MSKSPTPNQVEYDFRCRYGEMASNLRDLIESSPNVECTRHSSCKGLYSMSVKFNNGKIDTEFIEAAKALGCWGFTCSTCEGKNHQ